MSSDKQDASIREQRKSVETYASENGFKIIREYADHGISGDATEKRFQFKQMIDDAENGDFTAVLCWDQDRFGRFDSIEAGRWVHPLRMAGVNLVTVADGVIDWSDFAGRVMYGIKQEGKHQFLPAAVWINPPQNNTTGAVDKKRLPELNCPQKPNASLTHPRPGYPLASCVPAELASISPAADNDKPTGPFQQPLNTRAIPQKIPGGLGDWSPTQSPVTRTTDPALH
jgi:hypothetical protein